MGGNVLIVEDEPDVAKYLSLALRANGYTPVVANSVAGGLETLRDFRPGVICLDIMMPKESGASMYARIRHDEALKGIPVIMISGAVQAGQWDFRAFVPDESVPPPNLFLEKPVEPEAFIQAVAKLMSAEPSEEGMGEQ